MKTGRVIPVCALALMACSSEPTTIQVNVAPLTLPGIGIACYDIAVTTADDTVWSLGDIATTHIGLAQVAPDRFSLDGPTAALDVTTVCSDRFGNRGGGDITYIGTCDASASADVDGDPGNGVQNTVTVWLDGLYDATGTAEIGEWQDPCPDGCALAVDCRENQDTLARFDLTVMRDANQGFFDVAVDFDDVFCSAKLDTCYANDTATLADDEAIRLLFGGDEDRDPTGVFGFACTAGVEADTHLFYGAVQVVCDAVTFDVDPNLAEGNQQVTVGDATLHYGIYRGNEDLTCDDAATVDVVESCRKRYWNLAFDLADLASLGDCNVTLVATAADGKDDFVNGLPTTEGLTYPYLEVDGQLVDGGAPVCRHDTIDDTTTIKVVYHTDPNGIDPPHPVCNVYDGVATSTQCACPCWNIAAVNAEVQAILATGTGNWQQLRDDDATGSAYRSISVAGRGHRMIHIGAGYTSPLHDHDPDLAACDSAYQTAYPDYPFWASGMQSQGGTDVARVLAVCQADVDNLLRTVAGCGDGVPAEPRACEDQNLEFGDGCDFCAVETFPTYANVFAGNGFTCGLTDTTSLVCWADCDFGDYGHFLLNTPSGTGFTDVAINYDRACAIQDGSIVCWASDYADPLIDSNFDESLPPAGSDFTDIISGGNWYCALHGSDGSIACWGWLAGTPSDTGYTSLGGNGGHACALRADGTAVCWGYDNDEDADPPDVIPGPLASTAFSTIAADYNLSCAIEQATGAITCWGDAAFVPPTGEGYDAIGLGNGDWGCALNDGSVTCFGSNPSAIPPSTSNIEVLSVGQSHACTLDADGYVKCFGGCGAGHQPTF